MRTVNQAYASTDRDEGSDVEDEEREQGDKGDSGESGERDTEFKAYVWISLVEAVSDLTKYDFEKVFQMQVIEFFAFLGYVRFKNERERKRLESLNKKIIV